MNSNMFESQLEEDVFIGMLLRQEEEDYKVEEARKKLVDRGKLGSQGGHLRGIKEKLNRLEQTFLRGGDLGLHQFKTEKNKLENYEELQSLNVQFRREVKKSPDSPFVKQMSTILTHLYRSSVEALNVTAQTIKRQDQLQEEEAHLDAEL